MMATQMMYNWSDTDMLQFLINGECLEANFDTCAAFGRPLVNSLRGDGNDTMHPIPNGCRYQLVARCNSALTTTK